MNPTMPATTASPKIVVISTSRRDGLLAKYPTKLIRARVRTATAPIKVSHQVRRLGALSRLTSEP